MRMVQASQRQPWRHTSTVRALSWGLRGLYATLRPVYLARHFEQEVWGTGTPALLAFWHGRLLYFLHLYHHKRITVMVSQSQDGELISNVLAQFGVQATRGSSSRGGMRGLLEMVRKVQHGSHAAVTPDGPRGPRYRVQPGIISVAKKTGAPILPATYSARWRITLGSWDHFMLPLPGSQVVVAYGAPIYVPQTASAAVLEAKRAELEVSLQRITAQADHYFSS